MTPRRWTLACVLGSLLCALPVRAVAHDVDVTGVARVFLDQVGERTYAVSIVDLQVPPIADVTEVLPAGCVPVTGPAAAERLVDGFAFECAEPLTFEDALTFPWGLSGVVVLARWLDGSNGSAYFRGRGGTVSVRLGDLQAGAGSIWSLARTYLGLGAEHILLGVDHLLFLLGLLLLIRGPWPLVKTVTAFTLAHSMTLAAAVLGLVPVARGPVEAAIALSIVLLAREVVMGHRGHKSLVHRQPWVVAFVFGLLHGLGFAQALGAIGLRSADIPLALLFFNGGVELGQLAFVGSLVLLQFAFRGGLRAALVRFEPVLGYALGGLATLWLFERLPAVWGG